jgi:23S rRNA (adenine2503-C2)-methyltransferase
LPTVTNLTAGQMLEQVALANRLLRAEARRARNIVFMGMGEPLHNEAALCEALSELMSPDGFAYPPRRLLVSTVGVPDALVRLATRFPQLPLAVSLHSVRPDIRRRLMPIAHRHTLDDLRRALFQVVSRQQRPLLIEYLMLRELNDSEADALQLVAFLQGLPVHVNLIPYNAIREAPHLRGSERPRRDRFAGQLRRAGIAVTIRCSLGADIAAACGQLALRPPGPPRPHG